MVGGTGRVVEFDFANVKIKEQPPVPPYPAVARAARVQGKVVVEIVINPDGVPTQATAIEGPPLLRKFAEDYAMRWRFEPALLNGAPQWAKFKLIMPFRLTN